MNLKPGIALLAVASILFIVLIVPYAQTPLLYDVQSSARTSHHTNPEVFGQELTTKSDRVFADMQYLLDANERIIQHIRGRDFIAAIHEYERYDEKSQEFTTLATNLGLTQSDIGRFADENAENREIVFDIFIDSIRAEQLQQLQKMYEDQGDRAKADVVREQRRETFESLSGKKELLIGVHRSLAAIAAEYNLNEESHLQSIRSYETYLSEVYYSLTGEVRDEQEPVIPEGGDIGGEQPSIEDIIGNIEANRDRIRISFQASPEKGSYGDQIQIAGKLRGTDIANRVINIFIDNQNWATATTTESGTFETLASVQRVAPGVHAVYAYSGVSYSDIQLFSVESSASVLTMELEREPLSNNFICRGTLFAGDSPVENAPVEVFVNNVRKMLLTTDEEGSYRTVLTLPTGENTVHTVFQGQFRGFPVDPSRSEPVMVTTGHNLALVKAFLFLAGALIVIFVGVRLVFPGTIEKARDAAGLPRSRATPEFHHRAGPEPPAQTPRISPGDAFDDFLAFSGNNDWLNAIHVLYLSLKEALISKKLLPRRRSLTPREVSRSFENNEKLAVLSTFMERYEKIYYGRIIPEGQERETIATSWRSFLSTLGDDDH